MSTNEEVSTLCRSCGICCSGTIFSHVPLSDVETASLARHLPVLADKHRFDLPCPAWSIPGCTIYDERPAACRNYECALVFEQRSVGGDLEPKLQKVRATKAVAERVRATLSAADPEWQKASLSRLLGHAADEVLTANVQLDLAELGMRLKRDFGFAPPKAPVPEAGGVG